MSTLELPSKFKPSADALKLVGAIRRKLDDVHQEALICLCQHETVEFADGADDPVGPEAALAVAVNVGILTGLAIALDKLNGWPPEHEIQYRSRIMRAIAPGTPGADPTESVTRADAAKLAQKLEDGCWHMHCPDCDGPKS